MDIISYSKAKKAHERLNQLNIKGINLFNGEYRTDIAMATISSSLRIDSNPTGVTVVFAVEGGKTYEITKSEASNRFRVGLFATANPPQVGDVTAKVANLDNTLTYLEVNTAAEDTYLVITVSIIGEQPKLMIRSDQLSIDGEEIVKRSQVDKLVKDPMRRYNSYYEADLITESIPSTHQEINALYDVLVADYPVQGTKTVLGTNTSGYELIEYAFVKPPITGYVAPRLKVGITTGIHGDEKGPVYGFYKFFRNMLDNPYDSEILDKLKSNVDFYIIPVCNPSGYDAHKRVNDRNVNINRNFTALWALTPDDGNNYSGPSAASEPETQIIQSWLSNRKFDYFIDGHNGGNSTNWDFSYLVVNPGNLEELGTAFTKAISLMSALWSNKHGVIPNDRILGYITDHNLATTQAQAFHIEGAKAVTLEATTQIDGLDAAGFGIYTRTFTEDLIGNYIFEICKKFI